MRAHKSSTSGLAAMHFPIQYNGNPTPTLVISVRCKRRDIIMCGSGMCTYASAGTPSFAAWTRAASTSV